MDLSRLDRSAMTSPLPVVPAHDWRVAAQMGAAIAVSGVGANGSTARDDALRALGVGRTVNATA